MLPVIKRRCVEGSNTAFSPRIPPLLAQIYAARGVYADADIQTELPGLLPPDSMKGLDQAAALLADQIESGGTLLVVGDFDADGATSTALALLALHAMGAARAEYLVPNRFEFGYGLTPEIVEVAAASRPDLLITVDNGISSLDGVAAAAARGIPVLVTDHHLPGAQLPDAAVIVNPNQPGCTFASKAMAGVGVIFYVMVALRAELRRRQWFARRQLMEPNLAEYLDLVALGSVADVVPLDRNNRILVQQGLRRIRAGRCRPGMLALLDLAKRSPERVVASDLGFAIGPRLNAAGRLDDMSLGIQCLLTDDPLLAGELALQLDGLNQDRRSIEQSMQQEALQALEDLSLSGDQLPWGLCLYDPDWHQGVIGILASRIKERYHRPVIAFANADECGELLKGSARSIPGLHIRDALDSVASRYPGLVSKFGGHAMAAGLSLAREQLPAFMSAFDEEVHRQLKAADLTAELLSDGELGPEHFTLALAQQLRDGGPWGQQFPEPLFDGAFHLISQRLVGERHLKLIVAPLSHPQLQLDAIAFNVDRQRWPAPQVSRVQLAYRLDVNRFRGQDSLQLLVEAILTDSETGGQGVA